MSDFDYPAFLAARLDELEEGVTETGWDGWSLSEYHAGILLADVAAKRAILERWQKARNLAAKVGDHYAIAIVAIVDTESGVLYDVIKDLCRPFADHPDYQGER